MATEATAGTTPLLTLPNDLLFQPLDSVAVEEPEFPWEYSYNDRYPHKPQQYATEFDRKYPRDRFGDETDENAKVWKIYYDRARERDEDLIESWKETLDVLLVFAGLFSAVCAGFIVEAQGRLQPDWDEINARSAYALWASAQEGSVLRTVPPNPDDFSASIDVLFTNSLWFLSLTISLLASLLAILAKQWISQYRSRMRAHVATHKRWVWRHHISNRGLAHWKLDMIISSLPVMLHIALFLFLVGLVTFLLPLERHLAYLLASLSLFSFAGYLVTTIILPLIYDDCPMSTPLLWAFIFAYHTTRRRFGWWIQLHGWRKSTSARPSPPEAIDTTVLQDQRLFRSSDPAKRDVESLLWMVHHLPADEEVEAALDAIGTLSIADHRPYFTEAVRRDLHRRVTLRANTLVTSMNQDFNEAAHVSAIRTHLFLGELDGGTDRFPYARLEHKCSECKRFDAFILCEAMRGPAADVDSTIHFLEQWFLQRKNMDLEDGWTLPVLQSSIALWLHTSTTIVRDKELTFRQLAVLFHCFAGHLGEVLLLPDSRREYSDATQPHRASVSDRRPERIILALVAKRLRSFFGEVQGLTSAFRLRYRRGQNILLSALTLWGIVLQFDDEMDLHEDQKPVSNPIVNLYSALLVQTARRVAARNDELNIQDLAHSLNYVTMPEFMRHTWSIEVVSALYDLLQALIAIRDGVRHVYLSWTADTARFAFNVLCQHYFRHGSTARDLEQRRNALIHRLWNVPRIRPSELIRDGGFLDVAPEDGILNTLQLRSPGLDDDSSPIDDAASWTSYESHNTKKVSLWRILCLGSDTSRDPRLLRIATDLVIQLRPLTHRGYKVTDVRDMLHEVMNDTILRLYSLEVSSGELRRHILLLDKNEWTALERRLDTIRTNTPQSALLLPPSSMRTTPLRLPRSGDESPKVHSDAPSGDAHALLPSAAFVRADVLPYVNAASTSTPRTTQVSFADL